VGAENSTGNGKMKMAEATAGVSECWQQDMLQSIMVDMSWPQSI